MDILACLVGRGVALELDEDHGKKVVEVPNSMGHTTQANDLTKATMGHKTNESSLGNEKGEAAHLMDNNDESLSEISAAVEALRNLSKKYDDEGMVDEATLVDHKLRMKAIDELLRSHTYAVEMRRAAVSASAWLRSIGRVEGYTDQTAQDDEDENDDGELGIYASSATSYSTTGQQAAGEGELGSSEAFQSMKSVDRIDLLTLKAMLQTSRLEAKEKAVLAEKLNQELSECRAEIGRLRTSSRPEVSFFSCAFVRLYP